MIEYKRVDRAGDANKNERKGYVCQVRKQGGPKVV